VSKKSDLFGSLSQARTFATPLNYSPILTFGSGSLLTKIPSGGGTAYSRRDISHRGGGVGPPHALSCAAFDYTRGVPDISMRTFDRMDRGWHAADELQRERTWRRGWLYRGPASGLLVMCVAGVNGLDDPPEQLVWAH
jgi:hypothetical protein